jgi:hypothetical protein
MTKGIWNKNFDQSVPEGTPGNQSQVGVFYRNDYGKLERLVEAEGHEIAKNPEIQTVNPIGQAAEEDVVKSYNETFGKDIIIKKGKPNYEFYHNLAFQQPVGDNAVLDVVIAEFFYDEAGPGETRKRYWAYSYGATCTVDSANYTDGKLSVNFKQAGERVTGVIFRTDDGAGKPTYEFTPASEIAIAKMEASSGEVEVEAGKEAWGKVSFSPLGCPFDFKVESDDPEVCVAERRRQSVVITGVRPGEAIVTVTSAADESQTAVIEVTVS